MKIPYKGGGIALFQKNSETGLSLDDIVVDDTIRNLSEYSDKFRNAA